MCEKSEKLTCGFILSAKNLEDLEKICIFAVRFVMIE